MTWNCLKVILFIAISGSFLGCTHPSYKYPYTLVVSQIGDTSVITTDASKRSIIVNTRNQKFCAEPVPDATGTIATQLVTHLSGEGSSPTGPKVGGNILVSNETGIGWLKLFERSQGVQVLRDGMFRLCEAHINGAIDPQTYGDQLVSLITTLDYVVPIELCAKLVNEDFGQQKDLTANIISRKAPEQLIKECIAASYNFAKAVNSQSMEIRRAIYSREAAEKELKSIKSESVSSANEEIEQLQQLENTNEK